MKKTTVKKNGRPTIFTQELADTIFLKIADGASLRSVCREKGMPEMDTVWRWLREDKKFSEQYVRSTEERAEAHHEDLMELGERAIELSQTVNEKSSSAVVQAVKLKADNLKWSMSKMKPKKYGDKYDVTSDGKPLAAPIYAGQSNNPPSV